MVESDTLRRRLIAIGIVGAILLAVLAQRWLSEDSEELVFSTGQEGLLYHELAAALSEEVELTHSHITLDLLASKGSLENADRLNQGTAHLALMQNDTLAGADVRSITAIYPELVHFLCRKDSPIRSLRDLPGHTLALGVKGSGSEKFTTELLDYLNIDITKIKIVHLPIQDATTQLKVGDVDALLFLTGLGNTACQKALNEGAQLTPLVLPPGGESSWSGAHEWARTMADGFRVHYPHATDHTIPLLAYPGAGGGQPAEPIPTLGVQAVLVCHKDLPADLVETITRTIFEHRASLSQRHAAFSSLSENVAQESLQFPLHEGAEQYFRREEPGFLVKYAESMGFILSASIILWGLIGGIRKWLLQKRKDRIDKYYQAIESIIGRLREGGESLDDLEEELITLRKDALHELVKEKLAADESFVIYQNMANGCQQLLAQKKQERRQAV